MSVETTNALARASSSYLRSAQHQPVQWHEWGEEAFELARRENKPILLDIGAVWCHWCHVMDRESYDDPAIAALLNERFVAVKVDRDERPDIDSRYQTAIQAIAGQGGWPLTAFLTPEGKPFYGGTYFPPGENFGRPSFRRVLTAVSDAYREKREEVLEQANGVIAAMAQAESFAGRSGNVDPKIAEKIARSAVRQFDPKNGGFGSAPKFPHPSAIDLLLDEYGRTGDETLRNVIVTTLTKMAQGGVYDQLAGGFHRYSVDERWVVPHFEKMSYDNSELLKNYVHGFQATGEKFFADVARDIIRWVDEWLSDRERGGFYSSQDADINLEDDGDYFTWTLAELREVVTEAEADVAALRYDINEIGEMHHNHFKNVLFVRASLEEIAGRLNKPVTEVEALLASAKQKMYAARLKRPTPYIDKTIYVGWNGLMVSAYLAAARVLELADAQRFALRSLDRVLGEGWSDERGLRHVIAYSDPAAPHREVRAGLDDYAFVALACLDAYEATADITYFRFAKQLTDRMVERFFDATGGGFFDTEQTFEQKALGALDVRRKSFQDAPTPAGDPAAAIALLRLHAYTNEAAYRDKAEDTLEVFAGVAEQYGMFAATYGIAAALFARPHTQVVVVGNDAAADALERAALQGFAANQAVLRLRDRAAVAAQNLPPALADTIPALPALRDGKSFAVVCTGFACQPPVFDPAALQKQLAPR